MSGKWVALLIVFLVLVSVLGIKEVNALQEVAGVIEFDVKPGDTKSMQWGLISDDNNSTTLKLTSTGSGSELLSYPQTVNMPPHQLVLVNVTVAVPANHTNNTQYNPTMYATELGKQGGNVVVNLQVAKLLTIKIGSPPVVSGSATPEFGAPTELMFAAAAMLFIIVLLSSRKTIFGNFRFVR
jgi:hypothetical protein